MGTITAEKLGRVGALVEGIDAERFRSDDALPAWCLAALGRHGVLVFPQVHLDDATQVAFTHRLGKPMQFGVHDEFSEIWPVTLDRSKNPRPDYVYGTIAWHMDGTIDPIPARATMLSAKVLSETGGQTEFASTYLAYAELTEDEKARFADVTVVHTLAGTQRAVHPNPTSEQVEMLNAGRPPREHPLVWCHRDGRRSLVIGSSAVAVVGMDPHDATALLDGLLERATTPERVYRHEWHVGDVVLWDNCGTVHRVEPYSRHSPRTMHRTTIEGDEPIQ